MHALPLLAGKDKVKQETGQGNRQVLGDIGNLEVSRTAEGKQFSRPIKRFSNFLVAFKFQVSCLVCF